MQEFRVVKELAVVFLRVEAAVCFVSYSTVGLCSAPLLRASRSEKLTTQRWLSNMRFAAVFVPESEG